jgi:hypothetical protein
MRTRSEQSSASSASASKMDAFSRILIFTASFLAMIALALCIVGTVTYFWYYHQDANGNTLSYNFFSRCTGNILNGSSICIDMPRQTDFGRATENAGAFLVVAICLLGCGMLVVLAMNFVQLTGALVFIAPILLFLASLFLLTTFAEASRVTTLNSYSAHLVQTGHIVTILSLGIIAFAGGRLHVRYYERF